MDKQRRQLTYKDLMDDGMFYAFVGSCISDDNERTIESYDERIGILEGILKTVPSEQVKDIERIKNGLDLLKRERDELA